VKPWNAPPNKGLQLTANALANHLGTILASFLGCFSAPRWPLAAAEPLVRWAATRPDQPVAFH